MPAGRPTKYKPKYCEMLIEHMKQGYSFESFGAEVHVNRDTLYEWAEKQAKFSDAKKIAMSYSRKFWEQKGIEGLWGGKDFNPAVWIFNMRNRFNWTDRQGEDVEGGDRKFVFIQGGKKIG